MPVTSLNIDVLLPWMETRFSRSPGPGGQNVNKVNTQATLLLDFEACPTFSDGDRRRIRRILATRMSGDGRLRVVSRRERTQARNRSAAQERLLSLLAEALHIAKSRRSTVPTRTSRERRLRAKRERSELKRSRGSGQRDW